MIDTSALVFLAVIAVAFVLRSWWERREHNREIGRHRYRVYRGFDDAID